MRYSQPQSGPFAADLNSELLAGGKLLALIVGSYMSSNVVSGKPLVRAGGVSSFLANQGYIALNFGGAGDLSAVGLESIGGGVFVDFWYGRVYGLTTGSFSYLFGDYDGTNGQGLASKHDGIGRNWGYFDGGALNDSGEALPMDGRLECFVVVRDTISGTCKIYRNGILKITSAGVPILAGAFAVGSIGPGQYASFGTESGTLLAGRLRLKSWDSRLVRSFTNNPWQILASRPRMILKAATGGANTYSYTASGGMVLSGVAPTLRGRAKAASGGIQTGGAAGVARGASKAASGGLLFAGAASQAKGRAVAALGGLTFSGAATKARGVARTAAGGLQFAGAAGVTFFSAVQSRVVNPVGGILLAGAAAVVRSTRRAAAGGITFAGHAVAQFGPLPAFLGSLLPEFIRRRRRR